IDFLTGVINVIMGIDFDKLIELFNSLGLETRWLSTKETAKKAQKSPKRKIFNVNGRGIAVKLPNGDEILLGGGVVSKILYDNITPSNIAMTLLGIKTNEQ